MKKFTFIIILLIGTLQVFAQQRPVISTYMFNGLSINPAYAGSLNVLSATFVHRKQWINVDGAPTSQMFSAHSSFYSNKIGVGIQATRDKIGVHEETSFYGSYAYKLKTSLGILAMGLSGGFDNRISDFSQLNILDTSDPNFASIPTRFTPNFGTGVYLANPHFYVGLSVPYILENKLYEIETGNSEARESRYYYATGGIILGLTPNIKLSPSALIRYQEQSRLGIDLNATIIFDGIAYAGVSYRSGDALVFLTQLILNENFRFGYAYDATVNPLANHSRGTHELLLNYRIKLKNYKKDPQCPVYF